MFQHALEFLLSSLEQDQIVHEEALGNSIFFGRWSTLHAIARLGDRVDSSLERTVFERVSSAHPWWKSDISPPNTPPAMLSSFLFGERGRAFLAKGRAGKHLLREDHATWGPPARAGLPRGDIYANDLFLLFHVFEKPLGSEASAEASKALEAWGRFLADELTWLRETWASGAPCDFGFAHGVSGLLFALLWFGRVHGWHAYAKDEVVDLVFEFAAQGRDNGEYVVWPGNRGEKASLEFGWQNMFCNGVSGHGTLFAEAFVVTQDERLLDLSRQALHTSLAYGEGQSGFCCGSAAKAALASRLLRVGASRDSLGEALSQLPMLQRSVMPWKDAEGFHSCLSGLSSCLAVTLAEDPADPILDYILPPVETTK